MLRLLKRLIHNLFNSQFPLLPHLLWCCRVVGAANGGSSPPADSPEDAALTREVSAAVIDWIAERLADYHAR
jgi:hypothetical protein